MENKTFEIIKEPVVIRFNSTKQNTRIKKQTNWLIIKQSTKQILKEEGIPILISAAFFLYFAIWLCFTVGPDNWDTFLNNKIISINENQINHSAFKQIESEVDLPPGITINTSNSHSRTQSTIEPKAQDKCWLFFYNLYKVSKGLSYYFHYKNGFFSVIISVVGLIIVTVLIAFFRYKNFKKNYLILDCISIRWIDLLPQFFLLLVAMHIITMYLKPENLIIPFLWSIIICWTMGPYFFRQLFPYVTSFFKNRVYDAEMIIGERKRVIWLKYLISQHCLSIIMVLICYVLGNLILTESCMAYLVRFTNQGEFPSLGGILAQAFMETEHHGYEGIEIYKNISTTGIMSIACIFSAVVCFNAIGRCIVIFQEIRKQMVYEKR